MVQKTKVTQRGRDELAVPDGFSGPSSPEVKVASPFADEETEFHSVKQLSSAHSQRVEEMGLDTR